MVHYEPPLFPLVKIECREHSHEMVPSVISRATFPHRRIWGIYLKKKKKIPSVGVTVDWNTDFDCPGLVGYVS